MRYAHDNMPSGAIAQTNGTLNGRGLVGFLTRSMSTPPHTRNEAESADVGEVVDLVLVSDERTHGHDDPGRDGRDMRGAVLRMDPRSPARQQAVACHREEDPRLAILKDQEHRRQRNHRAERHEPARDRQAGHLERPGQRIGGLQLLVRHQPGRHRSDNHIDDGADREPAQNADRHVPLRVAGFLRRRRDRVEADVRKEHDRGALHDAAEAVRGERLVVGHVDVGGAQHDEQSEDEQLDDDNDVIGTGGFLDADVQQPGDREHDQRRRHVHQEGNTGDPGRRLQQSVDGRIRAQQRHAVPVREPVGQRDAQSGKQRVQVAAPGDRDRDVANGVLENQVPADDPGHELAKCRVRRCRPPACG
jgi:hypothetical protein